MVKKLLITGTIIILAGLWASPASAARIIFQDDTQGTITSNSIVLGSDKAGAANTSITFGADSIPAENGNITWNITSNSFAVDHTVNITGDLAVTGSTNIPGTTSDNFTVDSDNTATSVKLSFGSALTKVLEYDTVNAWFNLTNRLNIAGAGGVNGVKLTTRAGATDANQPQIEVRDSSNAAVFSVNETGDMTLGGLNNNILTFDADNAGVGANIDIVANQGSDLDGTLRYNATTNTWQISNNGGAFNDIPTSVSGGGTLDQSYDFGGAGAGRTVTTDTGPLKLDATTGTNAPLELTPRAAAPTTGLSAGQLMTIDGEIFIYDGTRAKWLSVYRGNRTFSSATADGAYLNVGSALGAASGFYVFRNATITGMAATISAGNNTKPFYVRRNAVATNLATVTLPTANEAAVTNLNVDVLAGDYLQVFVDAAGTAVTNPVVTLDLAYRP